ncbi:MAG: acetylornithine deacetylase [Pseudomonadota bacterium]
MQHLIKDTKTILAELVAFPTVSGSATTEIEEFIAMRIGAAAAERIEAARSGVEQRNLLFRFGPDAPGAIVLSGHTDVVPVADQAWSHPPFEMVETAGRLYGRGTCDMKGFLACMLAILPILATAPLKRPIWFAFTCDEEPGCLGLPDLLKVLGARSIAVEAVIVGEPSSMDVIDRHKGAFVETVTFHGVSAHSSVPWLGVSANEYATRFLGALLDRKERYKASAPQGNLNDAITLNLAQISGGTAHNIVADRCEVMWSLRCPAHVDPGPVVEDLRALYPELERSMQAEHPHAQVRWNTDFDVPPLAPDESSPAVALGLHLTGRNAARSVNYGTEAGLYQSAGYPTIVCGPGSIEQAHKPDEFIEIAQLEECLTFFQRLIDHQCR